MTDSQLDHPTVGATVAERLERRPGAGPIKPVALRIVHEFDALDRAVYAAIAQTPTATLDAALRRVSDAADHSKLWIGTAAGLAAAGGRRGRRSAMVGVGAVAITSASVNLLGKHLFRRARPDRAGQEVSQSRQVHMPLSSSFPSGHAASAFAFVNAVASEWPLLGLPLRVLAAVVGYSRVHTGVHYPGDVVVGSLIGAAIGDTVSVVGRRALAERGRC